MLNLWERLRLCIWAHNSLQTVYLSISKDFCDIILILSLKWLSVYKRWCILSSKQVGKRTDFTVDLIWWGLVRVVLIIRVMGALWDRIMYCGILSSNTKLGEIWQFTTGPSKLTICISPPVFLPHFWTVTQQCVYRGIINKNIIAKIQN